MNINSIPTISLVTDYKRMSKMTARGSRARIIDILCDAIEKELEQRISRAVESVNRLSLDNTEARRSTITEWRPRGLAYEEERRSVIVWKGDRWQEPTILDAVLSPLQGGEK